MRWFRAVSGLRRPGRAAGPRVHARVFDGQFFGNYFCLLGPTDAFVSISKNACTYLKQRAVHAHDGRWLTEKAAIHAAVGFSSTSPLLVPVADMHAFEAVHGRRHKFAVWRDPLERLDSALTHFLVDGSPNAYFASRGLNLGTPASAVADLLRTEWSKADPDHVDEHLRRQSDSYRLTDVDAVVALGDLDRHLRERGIPSGPPVNRSSRGSGGASVVAEVLGDPEVVRRARDYYAPDVELSRHLWAP